MHAKVKVVETCQKYNDPSSLDKVGQANVMLDDVYPPLLSSKLTYLKMPTNSCGIRRIWMFFTARP